MEATELTAEQEAEALRIADIVAAGARAEALKIGRLLVSRKGAALFGETEFRVRDAVHRIGPRALETALDERKKGGIAGRVASVPSVAGTRNSRPTRRKQ